jgi:alkylhydroperoxidase family enzyme
MTWIKTIPPAEADDQLRAVYESARALYPVEYAQPVQSVTEGEPGGIVASHSLIPEALRHAFSTFGALMSPELPLRREQHEMIATVVSAINRCHY